MKKTAAQAFRSAPFVFVGKRKGNVPPFAKGAKDGPPAGCLRYRQDIEIKILSDSQLGRSHPLQKAQRMGHPRAAVGEALSARESEEREVGEVLGGLGIDDYAVAGG